MNHDYVILGVVIIGLFVLFFFPEPQTNFLAYMGTLLFFVAIIIYIVKQKKITTKKKINML